MSKEFEENKPLLIGGWDIPGNASGVSESSQLNKMESSGISNAEYLDEKGNIIPADANKSSNMDDAMKYGAGGDYGTNDNGDATEYGATVSVTIAAECDISDAGVEHSCKATDAPECSNDTLDHHDRQELLRSILIKKLAGLDAKDVARDNQQDISDYDSNAIDKALNVTDIDSNIRDIGSNATDNVLDSTDYGLIAMDNISSAIDNDLNATDNNSTTMDKVCSNITDNGLNATDNGVATMDNDSNLLDNGSNATDIGVTAIDITMDTCSNATDIGLNATDNILDASVCQNCGKNLPINSNIETDQVTQKVETDQETQKFDECVKITISYDSDPKINSVCNCKYQQSVENFTKKEVTENIFEYINEKSYNLKHICTCKANTLIPSAEGDFPNLNSGEETEKFETSEKCMKTDLETTETEFDERTSLPDSPKVFSDFKHHTKSPSESTSISTWPTQSSLMDFCRICHCEGDAEIGPLIAPCYCRGSLRCVHQACLQQWIKSSDTKHCELCGYHFIMDSKLKPFHKWKKLTMSTTERRKILCSVMFHIIAITCVVWSLYVLIERTASEIKIGKLQWPFWTKLVVVAIGFTGGLVFMYVQCKVYVQLWKRLKAFNRVIYVKNNPPTNTEEAATGDGSAENLTSNAAAQQPTEICVVEF